MRVIERDKLLEFIANYRGQYIAEVVVHGKFQQEGFEQDEELRKIEEEYYNRIKKKNKEEITEEVEEKPLMIEEKEGDETVNGEE